MNKIQSYFLTALLFLKAANIYLRLKRYLKYDYIRNINFPNRLNDAYFYHSKVYNRAQQYMHANHFFGELLCIIRGEQINRNEMQRFAYLSSCAPVFDDFFEKNAETRAIRNLMHHPVPEKAKNDSERLAAWFFNRILNEIQNKEELLKAADHLFEAQLKSKKQINDGLSESELLNISIEKGGYSGLMYALLLDGPRSEDFLKLSFYLGSYGQLMDDVFDLFDDAKSGIRTFANQASSTREIRLVLEEHETIITDLISEMYLSRKNERLFKRILSVFGSVIEIAFQQYESIETKQKVSPKNCLVLERKNWIVDMEKAPNIWKLFKLSSARI